MNQGWIGIYCKGSWIRSDLSVLAQAQPLTDSMAKHNLTTNRKDRLHFDFRVYKKKPNKRQAKKVFIEFVSKFQYYNLDLKDN